MPGPHCVGQSLHKVHTCRLFTGTSSCAGGTRLSSLLLLRGVSLLSDLFSLSPPSLSHPFPSPRQCRPTPCHTRSSPEGICILGRYWALIGQVASRPASGLPYQWRLRLRDSQGEDKSLHDTSPFSAPNSSHCIVFFIFFIFFRPPPPPPVAPPPQFCCVAV